MMRKLLLIAITLLVVAVSGEQAKANPFAIKADHLNILNQAIKEPDKAKKQKVHVVNRGENLTKIAKKYHTTVQRLYDKNKNIKHPDNIKPGQKIVIPGNEKLRRRALSTNLTSTSLDNKNATSKPRMASNGFEWGWCTWYAQSQRPDRQFTGNAGEWIRWANSTQPKIGAVAVNTYAAGYGHVAIVIGIKGNQIKVRHMNWQGFGVVSEDWIDKSYWQGYIY